MKTIHDLSQSDFSSVLDSTKFNEWKALHANAQNAVRKCGWLWVPGFLLLILSWITPYPVFRDVAYALNLIGVCVWGVTALPHVKKARLLQKELCISDADIRNALRK